MEEGTAASMVDTEGKASDLSTGKRGGWSTFPFIIGGLAGLTLAAGGCLSNLIVYLIKEFNINSIDAAQVSNVVNGCTSLFPVFGAILADSFWGSVPVVSISSCISLLGIILLTLTATLESLRPLPCENATSSLCISPTTTQYLVLYASLGLVSIGIGGTRYTLATMGANQYEKPKNQTLFFNWYFITLYSTSVMSATVIVYVQDNVNWGLGFGISLVANYVGLAVFLSGNKFYWNDKPRGSPFTALARVLVAAVRKRKVSSTSEDCYWYGKDGVRRNVVAEKSIFRFLNRAAIKTEGDINRDGSNAKPWKLRTFQEAQDFKTLMGILPLWSSSIFLGTPIGIQASLSILQALTMDTHLGPYFKIPPGSFLVIVFLSTSISLALIDRFLFPIYIKFMGKSPTPLQRIGIGHVLNLLGMIVSAIVESKRLKIAHENHLPDHHPGSSTIVPMLGLWLFPQLVLVGVGEAFHFPGQVALYYQEFPKALKSTGTSMIGLIVGISFYLSTALIDLTRRVTDWLPDDINDGRLDNVYWVLVVIGVLNFGYYLGCAMCYNYQNDDDEGDHVSSGSVPEKSEASGY